jgi:hypothetical protein
MRPLTVPPPACQPSDTARDDVCDDVEIGELNVTLQT